MQATRIIIAAVLGVLETDPALAARLRAVLGIEATAGEDWIPLASAPLAKKTARRLARTGVIAARQVAGRWYLSRASLVAYLRDESPTTKPDADPEEALRAELGLRKAS